MLFTFLSFWWMHNTGSDYAAIAGEDINWEPGYKGLSGKGITIVAMGDGARRDHEIYEGRADAKEFLNAFYNEKYEIPPIELNESKSISQATLALSSGKSASYTSGVAPNASVGSYYFYDSKKNEYENLQYVMCHHARKWKVAVINYQYDHCVGSRFCRYVEPDNFTQKMASKCLYSPTEANGAPNAFVVPVEHEQATDVLFSAPVRWPLFFAITGTNNRGLPLDHASEGAGVFMSCPAADRAPISAASVLSPTSQMDNFTSTNASAAIFAGGLAVLYEQNPNYTIGDLMFLTAMTADQTQPDSLLWNMNSFGLMFSRRQGFGRLNLKKAVDLGENWKSVGDFKMKTGGVYNINKQMGRGTISFTVDINDNENTDATVLSVQLAIDAKQLGFGSLNPHVISPDGTDSELKILTESDRDLTIQHVELPSYKFLGDKMNGKWKIEFNQIDEATRGILTNIELRVFYVPRGPDSSLINQAKKANPFTPIPSEGFMFKVSESDMTAAENWSVPIEYPEALRNSKHILTYLQNDKNTTRMKVKATFSEDFQKITMKYVPSVFKDGLPMFFVVESLDTEKTFSAHLKINYHNPYKPGVILLEANDNDKCKATGKPGKRILSTQIPISKKCLVINYALNLNEITDDGYSSSVTHSIITRESRSILNRAFNRNTGEMKWKDTVPDNRHFIYQLSPTSSGRLEPFRSFSVSIEVLPHEGPTRVFESPYKLWVVIIISLLFALAIISLIARLCALKQRRKAYVADQQELINALQGA